jgi:SAM-dependent methyltransferase
MVISDARVSRVECAIQSRVEDWLTPAEQSLLASAWELRRRATGAITSEAVLDEARRGCGFDWGPVDGLQAGLAKLVERGWLTVSTDSGHLAISSTALETAGELHRARSRAAFGAWMVRSEQSAAYLEFCERVHGQRIVQFNMVDASQLEALLLALQLQPPDRVLDLGCGIGTLTEYIAQRTGAQATGIDFADAAIECAARRVAGMTPSVNFRVGDLDSLQLIPASFEVALSIDTLYFVHDLDRTLAAVHRILVPGGRFAAFYSAKRAEYEGPEVLTAGGTVLARALSAGGWAFETRDFTDGDHRYWHASRRVADELRGDFEAEGTIDLWDSRDRETDRLLRIYAEGRMRRYLYIARCE